MLTLILLAGMTQLEYAKPIQNGDGWIIRYQFISKDGPIDPATIKANISGELRSAIHPAPCSVVPFDLTAKKTASVQCSAQFLFDFDLKVGYNWAKIFIRHNHQPLSLHETFKGRLKIDFSIDSQKYHHEFDLQPTERTPLPPIKAEMISGWLDFHHFRTAPDSVSLECEEGSFADHARTAYFNVRPNAKLLLKFYHKGNPLSHPVITVVPKGYTKDKTFTEYGKTLTVQTTPDSTWKLCEMILTVPSDCYEMSIDFTITEGWASLDDISVQWVNEKGM